jgi:hypothetical protein
MDCLDVEDMRRRCNAHHHWMQEHPDAVAFGQAWADQNLEDLSAAARDDVNDFASPTVRRSRGRRA